MKSNLQYILFISIISLLTSCSATKFVPDGYYLLDEIKIKTDNKNVKPSTLEPYIRQNPNTKWFSLIKTQLYIYNMSGRDSTKWINKTLRRIGDKPVIYDPYLAQRTEEEMTKAVRNLGYMSAEVETHTETKKKKLKLTYEVTTGNPYIIESVRYDIQDDKIYEYFREDYANTLLKKGMLFDVNVLDSERQRITDILQRNGYYKFNKEYITYTADTIRNTYKVDLTLHLLPLRASNSDSIANHYQYKINKVSFITDFDMMQSSFQNSIDINDSIHYKNFPIYFKDKLYLRPRVLVNNLTLQPGNLYNEQDVQRTYNNFGRLSALKYTNIRFAETQVGDSMMLNAYVMLTKSKHQSVGFELEGTNSAGDLGAAAAVSYRHRNLFRGSENFMVRFRGAYEAITAPLQESKNENFMEYGVETSINFPTFMFPFLSSNFKRRMRATTEFGLQYNYQMRPEFTRVVASGSWGYRWSQRRKANHRIDLLDVNYLYMPWKSKDFEDKYLNEQDNYIVAYNFKNRLIVRTGYMYSYNSIGSNFNRNKITANSYSIRAGLESAGNILYAFSQLANLSKNSDGEYSILNIPFAQYIKGDFDFAKNIVIDERNSVAFRTGLGIAVPYGNAKVIPFEKRYFSGGANSVRGWSVRNLGPGIFPGDNNLFNQSGDIKFDANIEFRSKLFWKLQGAFFVDAGNIWTIRSYDEQPGGKFYFHKFYKQIAVSYGLGLRFDFDFFVLRFDGGMKAINPGSAADIRKVIPSYQGNITKYPIINPKFSRDFAFHFAVGYPF